MTIPQSAVLGLALSGEHLVALLGDRELTAALDASGVAFVIAGIDRVDGAAPGAPGPTIESTIAIGVLAARAPRVGWLAAAAVHRDHPYNLARRVASADHLSAGRSGLVLGASDGFAPGAPPEHGAWGGAGLTAGVPLGPGTTRDVAAAIRDLWLSWPRESIVADRAAGIYARGEQIRHIDHRGAFDIEGPLTVPTTAQVAPVLAWYAAAPGQAAAAPGLADLLIVPAAIAPGLAFPAGRTLLEVPAGRGGEAGYPAVDGAAGIVLRPAGDERSLRDLLAAGPVAAGTPLGPSTTLRQRLSLPPPEPLAGRRPAFPAPVPR